MKNVQFVSVCVCYSMISAWTFFKGTLLRTRRGTIKVNIDAWKNRPRGARAM